MLLFMIMAGGAQATWRSAGKQLQYEIPESGVNPASLQRYVHQGSFSPQISTVRDSDCQTELHSARLPIPVPVGYKRKAATVKDDPQMFLTHFTR